MSRIAYVNGRYVPKGKAQVAIEDRGYQFADGVYEVIEIADGALIDEAPHLDRLAQSLDAIRIAAPLVPAALALVVREVVSRNRVRDGMVYIQVSRGVAARDHVFPDPPVRPALVVTAKPSNPAAAAVKVEQGIRVITMPDIRWKRPDIKSISLLPNVLAKEEAKARGAGEAWLVGDDGLIREGAASNAWIIDAEDQVITHPVSRSILRGITRTTLITLLKQSGLALVERAFSPTEAYAAKEAFITGATSLVLPVVAVDDHQIAAGRPGPIVRDLRQRFHDVARRT